MPVARFIIHEVEVNRRRGNDEPIYEMVMSSVRGVVQQSGEKLDRVQTPKRMFCSFFEEFLVDISLSKLQKGRINRSSIEPIWDWLTSGWGPDDLSDIAQKLEIELKRDNSSGVAVSTKEFCTRAAAAIRKGISFVQGDAKEQRRLAVRLGGIAVLRDAVQIQRILINVPVLARLRSAVPQSVLLTNDEQVEHLANVLRRSMGELKANPELPIGLVLGRLAHPTDIARVVVQSLGLRDGARIAPTPYAAAFDLVVYDMGLLGEKIKDCIRTDKGVGPILYWLSRLHEYSTELADHIDIGLKSKWGKELLEVRNSVSRGLGAEITQVLPNLKQFYRRRPGIGSGGGLRDPDQVAVFEVLHGLALTVGCRPYLDHLSLNQVINTTETEVQRYLRVVSDALLNDVRSAKKTQQECMLKWFDTAVQFSRVVFGDEDAKLLARSGQVAARAIAS
ncbi:hypothetical protein MNBD_ALPHA09-264 [hydrothermal vent metagenome]|uniref:Uncharacterized protein n=1 Tax=hydrothermal vent metagenome TaxID=652676 RepID=A0A3B0TXI7_9ZZZZ